MYNILICDDQPDIVNALKFILPRRAIICSPPITAWMP